MLIFSLQQHEAIAMDSASSVFSSLPLSPDFTIFSVTRPLSRLACFGAVVFSSTTLTAPHPAEFDLNMTTTRKATKTVLW